MSVTLEQARALDALDRRGTFARAAAELRRGHTSVLYLVRTLEDALGFAVVDRSGYRTRLTPSGRHVLEGCRALLAAEAALAVSIEELRAGWEPTLTVVFDGIVPIEPLLDAVGEMAADHVPTRIAVRAEFLGGVEETFERDAAEVMISVLPAVGSGLVAVELPTVQASLVAHRRHPLARDRHAIDALRAHVLLTVRGSDPRLLLPTAGLELGSTIHLNDFASKKAAILRGIGFGWLPDGMITNELARGQLCRVRWPRPSVHTFAPRIYYRTGTRTGTRTAPGRAARRLIAALVDRE